MCYTAVDNIAKNKDLLIHSVISVSADRLQTTVDSINIFFKWTSDVIGSRTRKMLFKSLTCLVICILLWAGATPILRRRTVVPAPLFLISGAISINICAWSHTDVYPSSSWNRAELATLKLRHFKWRSAISKYHQCEPCLKTNNADLFLIFNCEQCSFFSHCIV